MAVRPPYPASRRRGSRRGASLPPGVLPPARGAGPERRASPNGRGPAGLRVGRLPRHAPARARSTASGSSPTRERPGPGPLAHASFSSVAAVGFGLTAYPIGAERGWVTRADAAERARDDAALPVDAPQGTAARGMTRPPRLLLPLPRHEDRRALRDRSSSRRSTRRCSLAGALFCQSLLRPRRPRRGADPRATPTRSTGASTGTGPQPRPPRVSMGWTPEEGFHSYDWRGYNEAMILYVLALGSPTHPDRRRRPGREWTQTYQLGHLLRAGARQLRAALRPPVLARLDRLPRDPGRVHARQGHRLLRELAARDARPARLRDRESRTASRGYGENVWGLTACDGPLDGELTIDGRKRTVLGPTPRAAPSPDDDRSTTARSRPPRPASSLPFAPEIVHPGARGDDATATASTSATEYGFLDAFNPTLDDPTITLAARHGRRRASAGSTRDYLGIDQGPIVAMIENHRIGARLEDDAARTRTSSRGLRRAGFTGGWLDAAAALTALAVAALAAAWLASPPAAAAPATTARAPCASGRSAARARWSASSCPSSSARIRASGSMSSRSRGRPRTRSSSPRFVGDSHAGRRAARQHLDPGVRGASGALEPLDGRVAALGGASPRRRTSPASGRPTVDGDALRDPLVRRHARALLPARPPRGRGLRRAPRTWSEWRDAMEKIQRRAGRAALRHPPADQRVGAARRSSACRRARALLADDGRAAPFAARAFREAAEFYVGLFRDGLAPVVSYTQLGNLYQEFARGLLRDVDHRPVEPRRVPPPPAAREQELWMTAPLPRAGRRAR